MLTTQDNMISNGRNHNDKNGRPSKSKRWKLNLRNLPRKPVPVNRPYIVWKSWDS